MNAWRHQVTCISSNASQVQSMSRSQLWGPSSAHALDTQRMLTSSLTKTCRGKPERNSEQRGRIKKEK